MRTRKIRVLVADDHAIVRAGIKALLQTQDDMEIVGEAENGDKALELARKIQPDVVLLDVVMPGMSVMEVTRRIVKELPDAKVLVLSSYTRGDHIDQLIREGATGYLVKQSASTELIHALREIQRPGRSSRAPLLAQQLASAMDRFNKNHKHLTAREKEVLQLIAEGYANKQIASTLAISIKTVEKYRQAVMDKLNSHQTAGLTRHAVEMGLVATPAPPDGLLP